MICPKCGANNIDGSNFCIKCGNVLKVVQDNVGVGQSISPQQPFIQPQNDILQQGVSQSQQQNIVKPQNIVEQQPAYQQPVQSQTSVQVENQTYNQNFNQAQVGNQPNLYQQQNTGNQVNSSVNAVTLNYFAYIIAVLLKPFKSIKEEKEKLSNPKIAFTLTLIITIFMTVINLLKTVYNTVRVVKYSYLNGTTTSWKWDNLSNINWISLIGKNFLIYVGVILAIVVVYYLGSLIIKKQLNFIKTLSIVASAIIPAVLSAMVISPLVGAIWSPLGMIFMVAGVVYSLIILYELMNDELKLEGDMKIYFNLACLGILAIGGYYLCVNMFMSSVSNGLNNILDMFK